MNVQAHMSGQFAEQVPNPAACPTVDQRRSIQRKIYEFLLHRQKSQELPQKKMLDIVRRLEEGLLKTANSKEEYLNLDTLDDRLRILIKSILTFVGNRVNSIAPSTVNSESFASNNIGQSEPSNNGCQQSPSSSSISSDGNNMNSSMGN